MFEHYGVYENLTYLEEGIDDGYDDIDLINIPFLDTSYMDENGDLVDLRYERETKNKHKSKKVRRSLKTSIDRSRPLSLQLKELYNYNCSVCRRKVEIAPGKFHVETHHLHPVNITENGLDIDTNMVVVCTLCHTYLDAGSMYICPQKLEIIHFDKKMIYMVEQ
ncbi:hypothetical protein [Bacillus infantis]|uniref:hypothetical protein n=1 Tax=Bacillus infantis TaxID=324767 RepID=UPI00209D730A|nr:hypothetical protein [Bacillus infantis]MCP1161355.1 hypothetical protein [Bacillus infantis]